MYLFLVLMIKCFVMCEFCILLCVNLLPLSTDGAAISYYHRTIERFVIPLFSQVQYKCTYMYCIIVYMY